LKTKILDTTILQILQKVFKIEDSTSLKSTLGYFWFIGTDRSSTLLNAELIPNLDLTVKGYDLLFSEVSISISSVQ
jgi:hypothetical protein